MDISDVGESHLIVTHLLLDEAGGAPHASHCLILGGQAELASNILDTAKDVSWIAVDIREQLRVSGDVVVGGTIDAGAYDRAIVPVPPDRTLARRWLLTAHRALAPGGRLILAGANAEGAKPVIADGGAIFGAPVVEHYRQKHRIAHFLKSNDAEGALPPWASADGIMPGAWKRFELEIDGERVMLETQPGVFAGDRLDAGTRLLLEHLDVTSGSRVLDVGCGAGIIGIAASRRGAAHVDLVDASLLAVEAAARNLERLGVAGRVIPSDVYSGVSGERYDLIVSNPPFHLGKQIDYTVADRLMSEAPAYLLPGGRLLVVANAFLAYGKHLALVFQEVETVAATKQYHVLMATEPR